MRNCRLRANRRSSTPYAARATGSPHRPTDRSGTILNPKTLRGRLSLGYAAALIVALGIFAALALAIVYHAQRSALDAELQATANAVGIVGDLRGETLQIDAKDREQFLTIVGARAQSAIVARDGSILASTDERTARTLVSYVGGLGGDAFTDVAIGGATMRLYVTPIRNGGSRIGETLAWRDLDVVDDVDQQVALAFALAIPILVAGAIFAGAAIARRGLEPLERIATVASAIEGDDLSRRLGLPPRSDELGRLAATFDRMLDRLQSAFVRERRFTSDASHELRAPLSVIRAEADLALRHDRQPAEYRRALETIASEADALEILTRDLLAAARNGSAREDVREAVDLASVAIAIAGRMSVVAGSRRIGTVDAPHGAAIVEGNRMLIERAAIGVLDNALKYTPKTGRIDIRIALTPTHAELVIADDGPGFSTLALAHGFDRFWRDDEARATDGSGLGLSLAKAIVERYGGTIDLANAQPHGALVRMSFLRVGPAALTR